MVGKRRGKNNDGAGSSSGGGGSSRRTGKIRLSPDPDEGVWFSNGDVVVLISETIQFNFSTYCPNWTETPQEMRELWWNWFKGHVEYDPYLERSVRDAWEAAMKPRLRDMIYRASTAGKKPKWMTPEMYELTLKRRTDPDFLKRSKSATENRMSRSGDKGKALGPHTMGRMNAVQAMDDLTADDKDDPSAVKLLEKSKKKKKKGGWVSQKAQQIYEKFRSKKTHLQEEGTQNIDENQVYYDVFGGFGKKNRVYGTGKAADLLYDRPPSSQARRSSATEYSPGVLSRFAKQNTELRSQNEELSQRMKHIEEYLTKYSRNFTPDCRPGQYTRRDDDDDDDDGGDGVGGSMTTPNVPGLRYSH